MALPIVAFLADLWMLDFIIIIRTIGWFDPSKHPSIYMPFLFNKSQKINTPRAISCDFSMLSQERIVERSRFYRSRFYRRFASFNGSIKFRKFDRNSVRNIGKVQLYSSMFRPRHESIFVRAVLFARFFRHLIKVVNARAKIAACLNEANLSSTCSTRSAIHGGWSRCQDRSRWTALIRFFFIVHRAIHDILWSTAAFSPVCILIKCFNISVFDVSFRPLSQFLLRIASPRFIIASSKTRTRTCIIRNFFSVELSLKYVIHVSS